MAESAEAARKARGLERLLLFSDGVAAIAVTLLVLPLVDQVTEADGDNRPVWEILSSMRWEMFSFVLSFLVIVALWMAHQRVFQGVATYDSTLLRAGMAWLFGIITLSFTTALIADHSGERLTVLLYIVNLAVAMGALTFATTHLSRHPDLLHPGVTVDADDLLDAWINMGLLALGFGLALVFPWLGFGVMVVLLFDRPVMRLIRRWRPTSTRRTIS